MCLSTAAFECELLVQVQSVTLFNLDLFLFVLVSPMKTNIMCEMTLHVKIRSRLRAVKRGGYIVSSHPGRTSSVRRIRVYTERL